MPRRRPPRTSTDDERPLLGGTQSVQTWRGVEYVVRSISGSASAKPYTCPGCGQTVAASTAHVVAWPALGETLSGGGVGERRHWHAACWRARETRSPR